MTIRHFSWRLPSHARAQGVEKLVQLLERLAIPHVLPEAMAPSRASFEG
jgi:hypothetical protein